ncbi:hypothetical protein K474DRAFT_400900 [Panus rudis PR-1116 ss-1]|nr:hypothetical protein K474DRAFT_400900 [Panus rudis PR-1116 ss-1]
MSSVEKGQSAGMKDQRTLIVISNDFDSPFLRLLCLLLLLLLLCRSGTTLSFLTLNLCILSFYLSLKSRFLSL